MDSLKEYGEQNGEHGCDRAAEGEPCNAESVWGRRSGPPEGMRYLEQGKGFGRG